MKSHTFALLLVFSLFFVCPSSGVDEQTLASICSQTQNQEICEGILKSDPRTGSADLSELALISINLTMDQASSNYDSFAEFKNNATDPALKTSFSSCVDIYQEMKEKIQEAYQLSQQKKYSSITQLGDALTLSYACENGIPADKTPTAAISEDMILSCETSASVNQFVSL